MPPKSTSRPPSAPRPLVGSVVQAVQVLRLLGAANEPQGVSSIARRLHISASSCFNILKTLAVEDLATFDSVSRTYRLGFGAVELARRAMSGDEVVTTARADMERLAAEHDAAVGLWRVGINGRRTLVALHESQATMRIHMVIGQRQPMGAGANGRAVLAATNADENVIRTSYQEVRWQRAPTEAEFVRQVQEARRRGWGSDACQSFEGAASVGAVIMDANKSVRACLSATVFNGGGPNSRLDKIGAAIRNLANDVTRKVYGSALANAG